MCDRHEAWVKCYSWIVDSREQQQQQHQQGVAAAAATTGGDEGGNNKETLGIFYVALAAERGNVRAGCPYTGHVLCQGPLWTPRENQPRP